MREKRRRKKKETKLSAKVKLRKCASLERTIKLNENEWNFLNFYFQDND